MGLSGVVVDDRRRQNLRDEGTAFGGGFGLRQCGGQRLERRFDILGRAEEVDIRRLRQLHLPPDAVKTRVDQQGKGQIGVAQGVRRAEFCPAVLPFRRRDPDQLGTVFRRPGDIPGGLVAAETAVGCVCGIQEGCLWF